MTTELNSTLEGILIGDLGISGYALFNQTKDIVNGTMVELGSYIGESSQVLLLNADKNNNHLYSVDVDFSYLSTQVATNPRFHAIVGDSSTVGKYWDKEIDLLFIDTFHIKQQVMSELYYWYPKVKEGGVIAFHDTNWPAGKYDVYGGIAWPRVEDALFEYFGVTSLNYEDDFLEMKHYPEKWGITIVRIKKKKNYAEQYKEWQSIFDGRNHLISLFWNEHNKKDIKIDLVLTPPTN